MPGFTPGRRWQPPYLPFDREPFSKRALATVEKAIKGPLFGCRMCGNCLLQETAFICPMECPKGERNGPCGGSTKAHCYVDETRPCIWYQIYDRSFKLGREEHLLEVLPPLDWDNVGKEQWSGVMHRVGEVGTGKVLGREPDWWQGDNQYHAPKYSEPASELERRLKAGEFVVTAEIAPPVSCKTDKMCKHIETLKAYVAAVNFTDSPSATPRTASWACSKMALERGAEPVMQIAGAAIGGNGSGRPGDPQHPVHLRRLDEDGPFATRTDGCHRYRLDPDALDPAAHAG
jgi:hypothetical protein